MTERLENPGIESFSYLNGLLPGEMGAGAHIVVPREKDQIVVCTPEFWLHGNKPFLSTFRRDPNEVIVLMGEKVDVNRLTRSHGDSLPELKEWYQVTPRGVEIIASRGTLKIETSVCEMVPVSTRYREDLRGQLVDLYIRGQMAKVSLARSLASSVRLALHELEIQTPQTP